MHRQADFSLDALDDYNLCFEKEFFYYNVPGKIERLSASCRFRKQICDKEWQTVVTAPKARVHHWQELFLFGY